MYAKYTLLSFRRKTIGVQQHVLLQQQQEQEQEQQQRIYRSERKRGGKVSRVVSLFNSIKTLSPISSFAALAFTSAHRCFGCHASRLYMCSHIVVPSEYFFCLEPVHRSFDFELKIYIHIYIYICVCVCECDFLIEIE